MNKEEFINFMEGKLTVWEDDIEILQDDTNRGDQVEMDDNINRLERLRRDFQDLHSRFDLLDEMSDEAFLEERSVLQRKMEEFEEELDVMRKKIEDI